MFELTKEQIKAIEDLTGYKYYPKEPYFTFINGALYNITFSSQGQIHTAKNDIGLSPEFRKRYGWHYKKRSLGTYLILSKWLPYMIELIAAIKAEPKEGE